MVSAILGGVQAARPIPIDKCGQPGIGDAEFFPRCIAAGCSPEKTLLTFSASKHSCCFDFERMVVLNSIPSSYICVNLVPICLH